MTDTTTTEPERHDDSLGDTIPASSDSTIADTTAEPEAAAEDAEPQSRREARYRVQLRDTEAERDALAARVETMQRAEIERLAADVIAKPAAVWASGIAVAELLDDAGLVDPDKVKAAAHTARETFGLELGGTERKKKSPIVPKEGTSYYRGERHDPWEDAFK